MCCEKNKIRLVSNSEENYEMDITEMKKPKTNVDEHSEKINELITIK